MDTQKLIVLVEDDLAMQALIFEFLQLLGFKVVCFRAAAKALAYLEAHPQMAPVVISDIQMPGMSGRELLRKLRSKQGTHPVVLISAFGDESIEQEVQKEGAFAFLNKPFKLADMRAIVESAFKTPA